MSNVLRKTLTPCERNIRGITPLKWSRAFELLEVLQLVARLVVFFNVGEGGERTSWLSDPLTVDLLE